MFPIYIPSKGRAELKGGTIDTLGGLPFKIVCEPQEYSAYYDRVGPARVIRLPKNNQGLAFSRQFIKQYSTDCGDEYHWQMDDDIRSFLFRKKGGHEILPAQEALKQVEQEVLRYNNIGQAGMNQNSWPPNCDRPIVVNGLPVQSFLVNNSVKAEFRLRRLNDMDFTMQILREGWCSLMFDLLRTNCPPIGTNAGGLHDVYQKKEILLESMRQIVKDNPSMSIEQDEKGWHLKKNRIFSTFKQQPIPVNLEPFKLTY